MSGGELGEEALCVLRRGGAPGVGHPNPTRRAAPLRAPPRALQAIDHTAKALSARYNKETPIIFNTYQVWARAPMLSGAWGRALPGSGACPAPARHPHRAADCQAPRPPRHRAAGVRPAPLPSPARRTSRAAMTS